MHSIIGVPRAAVNQGRGPVEVEQPGEQVGSMLPGEEGAAFVYLMASQRGGVRTAWSGVVELFRDRVAVLFRVPGRGQRFNPRGVWHGYPLRGRADPATAQGALVAHAARLGALVAILAPWHSHALWRYVGRSQPPGSSVASPRPHRK
jgi:hypothetical protein